MVTFLIWASFTYLLIGILITAFCVHMSYHEAAVGFGDSDDAKAQRLLESKFGLLFLLGLLFLSVCWPIAIWISIKNKPKASKEPDIPNVS